MGNETKTPDETRRLRDLRVSSDALMLIGTVWCAFGGFFFELYWVLGGTLLFIMGIMTLPDPEKG
jgi:hypothetical protein